MTDPSKPTALAIAPAAAADVQRDVLAEADRRVQDINTEAMTEGEDDPAPANVPATVRTALSSGLSSLAGAEFAACDPESVDRSLLQAQTLRAASAKRHNLVSSMLAEAVTNFRGAKGERYKREYGKWTLTLLAQQRAEDTVLLTLSSRCLELATARGDDVGLDEKLAASGKATGAPTQDDDPVTQRIVVRAQRKQGQKPPKKDPSRKLPREVIDQSDEEDLGTEDDE